jgi:L-ascorbate metabolism protein UlaG (beta-lactamase superfamily)
VYINDGIWSNDVKVYINEKMELKIWADWGVNKTEIENYVWNELVDVQSFEDVANYIEKEEVEEETQEIEEVKYEIREVKKEVFQNTKNGGRY